MRNISDSRSSNPYSNSSIRRRSETQPIQQRHINGSKYGYQQNINSRMLIQHSTFLPAIGKHQKSEKRYSDRWRSQGEIYETTNTIDTQSQTMEYLNQCERIIENLKKLTTISSKKVSRIRSSNPNYQHSRYNSNVQRQPSFFGSKDQYSQQNSFRDKRNDKAYNKNTSSKYAKILEQQSPQQIYCNSKQIPKNIKRNQATREKEQLPSLKIKNTLIENNPKNKIDKNNPQSEQKKSKSQFQLKNKDYINQFDEDNQQKDQKIQQNNDEELQHLKQAQQIQMKAQQQLKKAHKKQKVLMKYLGKARSSGCQLHKKIIQNKLKHKENETLTSRNNLKDKKIQSIQNKFLEKDQTINQQNDKDSNQPNQQDPKNHLLQTQKIQLQKTNQKQIDQQKKEPLQENKVQQIQSLKQEENKQQ